MRKKSIKGDKIKNLLDTLGNYEFKHIVSLGFPDETSVVEPFGISFKYWKEENEMHVLKRKLEEIILKTK